MLLLNHKVWVAIRLGFLFQKPSELAYFPAIRQKPAVNSTCCTNLVLGSIIKPSESDLCIDKIYQIVPPRLQTFQNKSRMQQAVELLVGFAYHF